AKYTSQQICGCCTRLMDKLSYRYILVIGIKISPIKIDIPSCCQGKSILESPASVKVIKVHILPKYNSVAGNGMSRQITTIISSIIIVHTRLPHTGTIDI